MDQAALQRVTLARSSGTLCRTARGARELTRRESGIFFWISWLTQWYCYAAMHCRYFAETKTLWKHLNSPAATTQVLRPRDSACFGEEFTGMASMSFDITMRCWPCLILAATFSPLDVALSLVHPETPFMYFVAFDGWSLTWPCVTALS